MSCCNNIKNNLIQARDYPADLSALKARRSTYTEFLARMLAQIPLQQVDPSQPGLRPLSALTTRDNDDPIIAFLDAWAVILDVLDFYQQRWLNENYLHTATEHLSLQQLAREIGYEFNPGLAASTWLAFTIDEEQGRATVPRGTQIQSLPVQDNPPQTFETSAELNATAIYNTLTPYQPTVIQAQPLDLGLQSLLLQGVVSGLKVGDCLLLTYHDISNNFKQALCTLIDVTTNSIEDYTSVSWQENLGPINTANDFSVYVMREQSGCFGSNAPSFISVAKVYPDKFKGWDTNPPSVWQEFDASQTGGNYKYYTDADLYLSKTSTETLSSTVSAKVSSYAALLLPGKEPSIYQIASVDTKFLAGFGVSGQVTGLKLQQWNGSSWQGLNNNDQDKNPAFDFRNTTIYVQSESMPLYNKMAFSSITIQKQVNGITLDNIVEGLQPGQTLGISSIANPQSEMITIVSATPPSEDSNTVVLTLKEPLQYRYEPGTLSISNNGIIGNSSIPVDHLAVAVSDPGTYQKLSFVAPLDTFKTVPQHMATGIKGVYSVKNMLDLAQPITIERAVYEDDITGYVVYWGQVDASHKLKLMDTENPVTSLSQKLSALTFTIPANQRFPVTGATCLVVVTRNDQGEMADGVGLALTLNSPLQSVPQHMASGMSGAYDISGKLDFSKTVAIQRAADESDVTHYVVYWGNIAAGNFATMGERICELSKDTTALTFIPKAPPGNIQPTCLVVYTRNEQGEMQNGIGLSLQVTTITTPLHLAQGIGGYYNADVNLDYTQNLTLYRASAADETDIKFYNVYWGTVDSQTKKFTKISGVSRIAQLPVPGNHNSDTLIFKPTVSPPVEATCILVYTQNSQGEMMDSIGVLLNPDNRPLPIPPQHLAGGITGSYNPSNPSLLTVTRAADESDITHYAIYWGKVDPDKKTFIKVADTPISILPKTNSNLTFTVDPAQRPPDATYLVVFTRKVINQNSYVEMANGVGFALTELQPTVPQHMARDLLVAYDINNKIVFSSPIIIRKAVDESDIEKYQLYWAAFVKDAGGNTVIKPYKNDLNPNPLIQSFAKTGSDITYTISSAPPNGATCLLVTTTNANGEMESGVALLLNLSLQAPSVAPQHFAQGVIGNYENNVFDPAQSITIVGSSAIDITAYNVYWGNVQSNTVQKLLAAIKQPVPVTSDLTFNITVQKPTNANCLLVVSKNDFGEMNSGPFLMLTVNDNTINNNVVPQHMATGIEAVLGNDSKIDFTQPVSIIKAAQETDILNYELYWTDIALNKISLIKSFNQGDELTYIINTNPPQDAKALAVFTKNNLGEMNSGVGRALTMLNQLATVPQHMSTKITGVYNSDDNLELTQPITIQSAFVDEDINDYLIYWGQLNNNVLVKTPATAEQPIVVLNKIQSVSGGLNYLIGSVKPPEGASCLLVLTRNAQGEMRSGIALPFFDRNQIIFNEGEPWNLTGTLAVVGEVFTITGSQNIKGHTVLGLAQDLQYAYNPSSSIIYGNVVAATHGFTVENEVLGSGDGTQANQTFVLKNSPLTYLPAATPQGSQSTLQIWVNNILWQEVPSFYGQGPNSTCYVLQQDEKGVTHVLFGDGQQGARLPTGQENIIATYRVGLGAVGQLSANNLILMQTRPLGVKSVTNFLDASGAADLQPNSSVQRLAPLTTLTLGRIVSLTDMKYFAETYPGIAKVQAVFLKAPGQSPIYYLTLCGENGASIPVDSLLYQNLQQAIAAIRAPGQMLVLASYQPLLFNLSVQLTLDPNYLATAVKQEVQAELLNRFNFAARQLAQSVTMGEIIEIIQAVAGVIAVKITKLYFSNNTPGMPLQSLLSASSARFDDATGNFMPAQLLTINPTGISLVITN